ncbi:C2 domain-containing protein [Blastocladiella britannica]|nr:C2 domain-containing protein [Blastocladiella britannica]
MFTEIHLRLGKARGLKNTDLLSKIDPYILVKVGQWKHKSKTMSGPEPNFDTSIHLDCAADLAEGHDLIVEVWDKDMFTPDDFLGRVVVSQDTLARAGGSLHEYFALREGKEVIGELELDFKGTRPT